MKNLTETSVSVCDARCDACVSYVCMDNMNGVVFHEEKMRTVYDCAVLVKIKRVRTIREIFLEKK